MNTLGLDKQELPMIRFCPKYLLSALLLAVAGTTQAQLVNGDFATGDFTGWTLYNTQGVAVIGGFQYPAYGGTLVEQVAPFDTAGTGTPQNSAEFQVGEVPPGLIGGGGLGQGVGIYQYVPLNVGILNISANIAAQCGGENADYGTFLLLINGNVVDSYAFGSHLNGGATLLSTLDYTGTITAGTYQIAIEMRRGGGYESYTPVQYLSDIQLSGTATPEPSTTALCTASLFVFILFRRRLAN
ncbi:MAG TPA: hypothetical protein VN048_03990 [Verrucomicrobiae bacterium]|nr:hypothetical protein [Verrucomicrobiae bacterium]